jgi:NADH-quinone oxidoreductase subunit G
MNSRMLARFGVAAGQPVAVKSEQGEAKLLAALDERVPDECVRISAAHPTTAALGAMFGTVTVEKLAVQQAA